MQKVTIYTDGACSGNPGPGGWAAVLMYMGHRKEISGADPETTNNRMELTAVIKALECLKHECEVDLYSDSAYVINAFGKGWIYDWNKNGWKTKDKQEVKNRDLWETLYKYSQKHKINWFKVKGHSDNEYNNQCDKMARDCIKELSKDTSD